MKLHLPKGLFIAVLAAMVSSTAQAGWGTSDGDSNQKDTFFYNGDSDTTLSTGDSLSAATTLYLKPNSANSGTLSSVTIANGDKLIITGKWNSSKPTDNFAGLTITTVTCEQNANTTLEIGAHQNAAGTLVGNQVVTIKNSSEKSYKIAHTIVNQGATLNFSPKMDAIDYDATMVMDVAGTVDFGNTRQTVGNFTLNLTNGSIKGTNYITGGADGWGAIDFKENITGKITSSGTSSISGGVRIRSNITIDVSNNSELTIDTIIRKDDSDTSGIIKSGAGTLTLTIDKTFKGGLYRGNTTLKDGGTIKYAVAGTQEYVGTISGVGNVTMSGAGSMTLAKIENLNGDISVTNGKLTITELLANKTIDISVADGKTLNINSVTVNIDNWDSNTSDLKYYDSRGEGAAVSTTGNGFRLGTYLLFDGYEWNGTVNGYTTSHTNGDTYLTESSISGAYYINSGEAIVDSSTQSMSENYMLNGGTMKVQGISLDGSDITIASSETAKGISLSESGSVTDVTEAQFNSLTNVTIGDKSTFSLRGFTTAENGLINASKVGGTGILELKLKKDNGINFNLSNFEGDIVVKKDTGADSARLQLNKSTFHENATIVLAENNSDIVINGKDANGNDYVLTTNVEVKGDSTLHLNSSNKATITSTITGAGTLTKAGSSSTLTLNGTIQVSDFKATSGTTNVIGGTVSKLTSGTTTNISGGSVNNMVISAGTVNISGGSVSNITYTAGGTVNFKLAEGKETASFTVENVLTSTKDEYGRHMNVAKGVTLNATTFTNQWGMGTLDVDGILNAESLIMTSGGHGENNNVITGDGVINLDTLVITNAGTYRFKAAEINIDKEVKQDKATMNLESGVINLSGTLNMTGGTFNMIGGTLNLTKKEVTHKFSKLDMAGNNDRDGHLKLAADVALEVGTDFWLGGTSTIALAEGATLTKDGMTITGSEKGTLIDRLTSDEGGTDNPFKHESTSHEVNDGHVTISKQSDSDLTLGLKLTNSSVTNESSALLKVTNAGNTLNGVIARGGSIALQNVQAALSLDALEIAAGKSVTISGNEEASNVTVTQSASFGAGARLDANLTLKAGTKVTMGDALTLGNGPQQASEEVLLSGDSTGTGYTLSLEKGLTLQGNILKQFDASAPGSGEVILFSGVDTLKLGGVDYNALTDVVKLSTYFSSGSDSVNFDDYYIGFNEHGDVYAGLIVPEPTTATLSLLALAGLCARRRRASR